MITEKKQFKTVDFLKFVFAIAIVALHTRPFYGNSIPDYYFMCLARLAVPFFFMVSSYFFWKKRGDIRHFVSRLLILYFVWFIIQSPIVLKSYFFDVQRPALLSLAILLKNLLVNSTFTASWFIMALVEAMVVIWWLDRHSFKKLIWVLSIALYVMCLCSSMYFGIVADTPFSNVNSLLSGHFPWANSFAAAFLYVAIGKYLAEHELPDFSSTALSMAELFFLFAAFLEVSLLKDTGWRITDSYLSLIPLTTVTVVIALKYSVNISDRIAMFMRKSSTLLYVSHGLFIFLFSNFVGMHYGLGLFLCVFGCSFILSMLLISCSCKWPVLKYFM